MLSLQGIPKQNHLRVKVCYIFQVGKSLDDNRKRYKVFTLCIVYNLSSRKNNISSGPGISCKKEDKEEKVVLSSVLTE